MKESLPPSLWEPSPRENLSTHAEVLGISEIRTPQALELARQTGFVWTRQAGVVCQAANRQYLELALANPDVIAVVTKPGVVSHGDDLPGHRCLVVCDDPEQVYLRLHIDMKPKADSASPRIDPSARVDPSAILIGDVVVEADATIGPRVVATGPIRIGAGAHIEAGALLGCEGLFAKTVAGRRVHIPHHGGVDIGDRSYIHSGAVIVRSAIAGENTIIGEESHIGIMANIGHDAMVGARTSISSHVVIAGRARIGEDAWIGASAVVSNEVVVGAGARVRIGAVVVRNVPPDGDVSGNFARSHTLAMKAYLRESQS